MGVQGLWQLIQGTGRPVTLESLEGKILAVDVSIWLNQSMKGMRDKFGNPLPNAHLLSLYHRICKLLYYRIKPVFVFDGGVPLLKKQTLAARRQRRLVASESSNVAAKKLLSTILKQHAVSTVLGTETGQKDEKGIPKINIQGKAGTSKEENIYVLPPLPETDKPEDEEEVDYSYEQRVAQRQLIYEEYEDIEEVDVDSEDFKVLPPEVKHEILTDIKDSRKRTHWADIDNLPEDSQDFSNYQIAKLMKQSKLTKKIENVRKEMTRNSTGDVAASVSSNTEHAVVESSRVISEDASHYILIKGLSKLKECEKPVVDIGSKYGEDMDVDLVLAKDQSADSETDDERGLPRSRRKVVRFSEMEPTKTNKIEKDDPHKTLSSKASTDITEISKPLSSAEDDSQISSIVTRKEDKVTIVSDDDETTRTKPHTFGEFDGGFIRDSESDSESPFPIQNNKAASRELPTAISGKEANISDKESSYFLKENVLASPPRLSKSVNESGAPVSETLSLKRGVENDKSVFQTPDKVARIGEVDGVDSSGDKLDSQGPGQASVNSETGEQSDASDDDFIEVTVDVNNIQPDEELFPASIFDNPVINSERKELPSEISLDQLKPSSEEGETIEDAHVKETTEPAATMATMEGSEIPDMDDADDFPVDVVADQFNEFDGMSKEELSDLQHVLEMESQQLQEERGKQERLAATVTDQMYLECQDLLKLFGIPYLASPMEAEAQCAFLEQAGLTSGTVTDDSDIWLFGGQRVYKNFFNQSKNVECYKLDDIQKQMMLSRRKLINVALLCGSDYTVGIQGVGGVTALEILTEFTGGDDRVLHNFKKWWDENHDKVKIPQETKVKASLRKLQLQQGFPSTAVIEAYLKPTIDDSEDKFSWSTPDLDYLREFAASKFGWTRSKVDESLLPMIKRLNESSAQSHITSFFSVDFQDTKKPKSSRVKRVLNRLRTDNAPEDKSSSIQGKRKVSKKGKQVSKGGKTSGTKTTSQSSGSGWVGVPTVRPTVPKQVELSEASDVESEKDDMFNDSEGDEILKNINLDLCGAQSARADFLPKTVSKKGKGRGKGKSRESVPMKKTVTLKSSLDKDTKRKPKGRQSKTTKVTKPARVVLSESGSSSD